MYIYIYMHGVWFSISVCLFLLMQAKLAQVPIYPWCVVGFWFVFAAAALFVLSSSVTLQYADWF